MTKPTAVRYLYRTKSIVYLHWVSEPELRSSGGNRSSNPHVSVLIIPPASNRMGIIYQRHWVIKLQSYLYYTTTHNVSHHLFVSCVVFGVHCKLLRLFDWCKRGPSCFNDDCIHKTATNLQLCDITLITVYVCRESSCWNVFGQKYLQ